MATVFYRGFTVCKIDSVGRRIVAPGENVDVTDVTTGFFLVTLTSDNEGNIPGGSVTATVGDILQFQSSSTGAVFRQTAAATLLAAFKDPNNNVMGFVIQDLSTAVAADSVQVYLVDTANPKIPPFYAGTIKPNTTGEVSYETTVAKSIDIVIVGKDTNNKFSQQDLSLAPKQTIAVPASGGSSLVVGTTTIGSGTNGRVLYQAAGVLSEDAGFTIASGLLTVPELKAVAQVYNHSIVDIQNTIGGFAGNLLYAHNDINGLGFNVDYSGRWFLNGATGSATFNVGIPTYNQPAISAVGTASDQSDLIKATAGASVAGSYFLGVNSSAALVFRVSTVGTGGDTSIGHGTPSARLHVISTTEQLRLGYDTSNYAKWTIGSTGLQTIDGAGSGKGVLFASGLPLGFFGATAIVQPTTAIASATFVTGLGGNVLVGSTFDGYKIDQIVKALRNLGILA